MCRPKQPAFVLDVANPWHGGRVDLSGPCGDATLLAGGEHKRAGRTHRRADREPYRCSLLMWRVWRVGARFCPTCPAPSRSHRPPARGDPHWLATRAIVALPSVETAGLWDPWGFSKNEDKLYRYRCVEIKHGRVAMLAVTGCVRRGGKRARHDSPRGGGAARRRNLRALWR